MPLSKITAQPLLHDSSQIIGLPNLENFLISEIKKENAFNVWPKVEGVSTEKAVVTVAIFLANYHRTLRVFKTFGGKYTDTYGDVSRLAVLGIFVFLEITLCSDKPVTNNDCLGAISWCKFMVDYYKEEADKESLKQIFHSLHFQLEKTRKNYFFEHEWENIGKKNDSFVIKFIELSAANKKIVETTLNIPFPENNSFKPIGTHPEKVATFFNLLKSVCNESKLIEKVTPFFKYQNY